MAFRSYTVRLGILLSTVFITAIIISQLIWLKKTYELEQREFNARVLKVIKSLYTASDDSIYKQTLHLSEIIDNNKRHFYTARITLPADTSLFLNNLKKGLEEYDVFTLCQAGIYDHKMGDYIFTSTIPSANSRNATGASLPPPHGPEDHLALYFPNRNKYILSQMSFWFVTGGSLLLVLLLFGAGIYLFFRQKFLNEMQKDFIQNFSHEFKTPVSVLTLAADVLKTPGIEHNPERLQQYAGIVINQTSYLKERIEKLVELSATDATGIRLEKKAESLHQVIREAIDDLAPLIEQRKAQVNFSPLATHDLITADKNYLVMALVNLLENALKYASKPKIDITTRNSGSYVQVAIKDNGPGIEKRYFKKIFNKFYRIKTGDVMRAKGLGIGLHFTKEIVKAHKGKIFLTSTPEIGSIFSINFPVNSFSHVPKDKSFTG